MRERFSLFFPSTATVFLFQPYTTWFHSSAVFGLRGLCLTWSVGPIWRKSYMQFYFFYSTKCQHGKHLMLAMINRCQNTVHYSLLQMKLCSCRSELPCWPLFTTALISMLWLICVYTYVMPLLLLLNNTIFHTTTTSFFGRWIVCCWWCCFWSYGFLIRVQNSVFCPEAPGGTRSRSPAQGFMDDCSTYCVTAALICCFSYFISV